MSLNRPSGQLAFVGRARLMQQIKTALDAGLDVWLTGEHGVGKTALARRVAPHALYCSHVTPAKELLGNILSECYQRGWWLPEGDEEDEGAQKAIGKLDIRARTEAAATALKNNGIREDAVLILDDFDGATTVVVRACRRLAESCTVIACGTDAKAAQRPFLVQFTHIEVPRLTRQESEQLVTRLLDGHAVNERERPRLVRQLVEQGQGVPLVLRELVKRAASRGDLSARAVGREELHGHKTVDLTPALIVLAVLLVGVRVAFRGLHDADMTVLFGFSGALLMLIRIFASRLGRGGRR